MLGTATMTRKGQSITLSVSPEEKEQLESMAALFSCLWGGKPNLSELNRAIASGRLKLSYNDAELPLTKQGREDIKSAIAIMQEQIAKLTKLI